MAENEKKSSKTVILLAIVIVLLILLIGAVIFMMFRKNSEPEPEKLNGGIIQYEANVVSPEDAQKKMDELAEAARNGNMTVSYKGYAYSEDGTHFTCEINNSIMNEYDMYINIYKDSSFEDQILLTGLIPPGSGIQEFDSEIPLSMGEYETTLVLTQVEDDHSTLHAQAMLVLRLVVE